MKRKRRMRRRIRRIKRLVCLLLFAAFILFVSIKTIGAVKQQEHREQLDIRTGFSEYMLLGDLETGEIISEQNGSTRIYPASMTKLMTVLVALERMSDPEQKVTVTEEIITAAYMAQASVAGFAAGEQVSVTDLLYATMLPSGADAAWALSAGLAGDEASFVWLMNQKAEELGMTGTHFTNVVGLHDEQHYSTPEDIFILLKNAMNNDIFKEVFTTSVYCTGATDFHPEGLVLNSTLFSQLGSQTVKNGSILGGKTGYTRQAGMCLASAAEINGRCYLLITANAPKDSTGQPYHIMDAFHVYNQLAGML